MPPLECCRGTIPNHAANCRPFLKVWASPTVATTAVAVIGPTPGTCISRWVTALQARRGFNKAVVALAAKHARILWALLATGRPYHPAGVGT